MGFRRKNDRCLTLVRLSDVLSLDVVTVDSMALMEMRLMARVFACALMASQINARRVGGCFVPASSSRTTVPRDAASGARRPLPIAPALKSSRMDSGKRTAPMRPPQTPSARRRALWRRTIAPARRCTHAGPPQPPDYILATVSGRKVDKVLHRALFESASERRQVRK